MLGTGTTQNTTEQPEHATLEGQGDPPPQSNLPESLQLQSHLPSLEQLEQDGYDSDSGIDHNAAINGEGPLEVDEPDIPEVGASSSTLIGVSDEQSAFPFLPKPIKQHIQSAPSETNNTDAFNDIHLCSDYRIVNDTGLVTTTDQALATTFTNKNIPKEKKWKKNTSKGNDTQQQQNKDGPCLFDELDDEALNVMGVSVNPLVTIVELATLGASLQLNGGGSRFVPDWLGPTLAALWEGGDELWCKTTTPSSDHDDNDDDDPNGNQQRQQSRRQVSWEAFFVYPVYRPNPKYYFPTEQLYQFTIVNQE